MTLKFPTCLFLVCSALSCLAQTPTWEHLTPLKGTDRLFSSFAENDQVAYMGGAFGVLLKTVDGGESWTQEEDGVAFGLGAALSTGISFPHPEVGYICDSNARIYKIGGEYDLWTKIWTSPNASFTDIHFQDSLIGFVTGFNGAIYKTENGGVDWENLNTGIDKIINDIHFVNEQIAYATARDGVIIKTTNGGEDWILLSTGTDVDLFESHWLDEYIGVAVGRNGLIIRTTDGGENWNFISSGTDENLTAVKFINSSRIIVCGINGALLKSTNSGVSFSDESLSILDDFQSILVFSDNQVYVLGEEVVFESLDQGNNWNIRHRGIFKSELMRMQFTDDQTIHVVGRNSDSGNNYSTIVKSKDQGRTWATSWQSTGQITDVTDLFFVDENNGFASAYSTFRNTTDGGESNWNYLNSEGYWTAIHMFDLENGLASRADGIWKTTDGTNSWEQVHVGNAVNHFFFSPDNLKGFVVMSNGGVARTFDGGNSWENLNINYTGAGQLRSISFVNDTFGIVIGDGVGRRTLDGGDTWEWCNGGGFGRDLHFPDPNFPMQAYAINAAGELLFTKNGALNWEQIVAPINNMTPVDMVVREDNTVYICGEYGDVFRTRLECMPSTTELSISACDFYIDPMGDTLWQSGQTSYLLVANGGCDSLVTINLEIGATYFSTLMVEACDSFLWQGNYLYADATLHDTLTNAANCDSIQQIHVVINASTTKDTIITACEAIEWIGQTYTTSGNYQYILPAANGCDSIFNLALTINDFALEITDAPQLDGSIDLEVNGNFSNAALIQWLDCENDFAPISNATEAIYTANQSGNFAAQVAADNCQDTSACFTAVISTINELHPEVSVSVFPNPAQDGTTTLSITPFVSAQEVKLYNTLGVVVKKWWVTKAETSLALPEEAGVYFLQMEEGAVLWIVVE